MPLTVNEARDSFSLAGRDVEPLDPYWPHLPASEHLAYYRILGEKARHRKLRELDAGVGVNGRRLASVKPESRRDGGSGPPLSPHNAASRFQRYLRVHVAVDRCVLYWGYGWRKVVRGHRIGWGALPIRDVVGLTKRDFAAAVAEARSEWAQRNGMGGVAVRAAGRPATPPMVARGARR